MTIAPPEAVGGKSLDAQAFAHTVIAAAWHTRAPDLADWTLRLLVNRDDVAGGYIAVGDRGKIFTRSNGTLEKLGSTTTRPGRGKRGGTFINRARLIQHFRPRTAADILGLHTTSTQNTSRWCLVDFDVHGPGGATAQANFRAAETCRQRLLAIGFTPLLLDSNGTGGLHLLVVFNMPVPTPNLYAAVRWLVSDYAAQGLLAPPETFPKQPSIKPGGYGNWCRLLGHHHTRDHWTRVWDGRSWLDAAAAVDHILATEGADQTLIPPAAASFGRGRTLKPGPEASQPVAVPDSVLARRISAYVRRLPNLGEGQGRDDVAYKFGAWLTRDLALPTEQAIAWLLHWDSGNRPPKGETRLREILVSVSRYGQRPIGCGLAFQPHAWARRQILRTKVVHK
jgi:hypothetical protein